MDISITQYPDIMPHDLLPVGENSTIEDENFDIVINNNIYNVTDIYDERTIDIAKWVFKNNTNPHPNIHAARQEIEQITNKHSDFIEAGVDHPSFNNTHWVAWFTLTTAKAQTLTIEDLAHMGIFDALDKAVEHIAQNTNIQPRHEEILEQVFHNRHAPSLS